MALQALKTWIYRKKIKLFSQGRYSNQKLSTLKIVIYKITTKNISIIFYNSYR